MGSHEKTPSFWLDAAERIGCQAAYAVVTEVAIILPDSHISQGYLPLIMLGLNVIKVALTKLINGSGSAVPTTSAVAAQSAPVSEAPTGGRKLHENYVG